MKNLINIELKKLNLTGQIKGVVIANIIIFPLLAMIFITDGTPEYINAYELVDVLIKSIFLVWQAVLISKLIVDEFKTKTIQQLYTYPLKRSAIMGAKIILITGIMIPFIWATQLIQHSLFSGLSLVMPQQLTYAISLQSMVVVALTSIFSIMVGMIPLAVGLWTKSTLAPPITAFVLLSVMGGTLGETSLGLLNNLIALFVIGMIGVVASGMAIQDMMKKDLIV